MKKPMKKLLALRHVQFENLGTLTEFFLRAGFSIQYVDVATAALTDIDPLEADLMVVLGGPMGVYETEQYPFLRDEIELLVRRIGKQLPTLGICLGSQLIAAAMGAKVYPGGLKEIGWAPLELTHAGQHGVLASLGRTRASAAPAVLHWHGDTFDLPPGATLLASTPAYPHQAFSIGDYLLALQFHIEVVPDVIEPWIDANAHELHTAGISAATLHDCVNPVSPAIAHQVMGDWLAGLAGE